MSTYSQILYQIIFSTKNRERVLEREKRKILFKYIWGVVNNKNCFLYRINGVEDHLHILVRLHPNVALSSLVKAIKLASSQFIKKKQLFENFRGWQTGYAAFTYSIDAKDQLIEYIKKQEEHHKFKTYKEELIELLQEHKVEFEEKYLF